MMTNLVEAVFWIKNVWNQLMMKSKNVDGFVYRETKIHMLSSGLQHQQCQLNLAVPAIVLKKVEVDFDYRHRYHHNQHQRHHFTETVNMQQ